MNIQMQKALEHAVEVKAAEVAKINTFSQKATQTVTNAIIEVYPEVSHQLATTVAINIVADTVQSIQDGGSPLGKVGPAVLGKALSEQLGDVVTTAMVNVATKIARSKRLERQKREDEQHRQEMMRAPVSGGNGGGPSLGIDLGGFAVEQAKRFAVEDAKAAAPVAPQPSAFIDPDADAAMVLAAGERTLASAYPAAERGPAPSAAVVAGAIERAKDTADRADIDIAISGRGRYPAPKRKSKK